VPAYDPRIAAVAAGDAQWKETSRTPFRLAAEVTAANQSRMRVSRAWFPGWAVRIDGRAAAAEPAAGSGLVEFAVPPGKHEVEVRWDRSPARRLGEMISLTALLALVIVAYAGRFSAPAAAPKEAAVYSTQSS
jgi:hypothetical protein